MMKLMTTPLYRASRRKVVNQLGIASCWVGRSSFVPVRRSSSWAVTDYHPWTSAKSEGEEELSKEMLERQLKKKALERLVANHVRQFLEEKFPMAFSARCSEALVSTEETNVTPVMETLVALNGYERVPVPLEDDFVPLAEGIIVEPDFYKSGKLTKNIFMFAQSLDKYAYPNLVSREFPELVEEDIRVYRILENIIEELIMSIYNMISLFLSNTFVYPLEALASRLFKNVPEPTKIEPLEAKPLHVKTGQIQNLIVLEGNRAVLVTHMSPSVHLLALPHTLGHKTASTIISVSLVVFGAAPLAYRSLHFALNYPLLSDVMVASVLGTIVYGIWHGQSTSRTRQSEVVCKGMGSRIYARDDAVLWSLQEGAVQRVTQLLLSTYHDALKNDLNELLGKTVENEEKPQIPVIDPPQMLTDMGLLVPAVSKGDQPIAILLEEAIAILKSKSKD